MQPPHQLSADISLAVVDFKLHILNSDKGVGSMFHLCLRVFQRLLEKVYERIPGLYCIHLSGAGVGWGGGYKII